MATIRISAKATAPVEIELKIGLYEFGDDEIAEAFHERGLGIQDDQDRQPDFDRLAELIAEGNRDEALDLLHQISPDILNPTTIKRLADDRRREAA